MEIRGIETLTHVQVDGMTPDGNPTVIEHLRCKHFMNNILWNSNKSRKCQICTTEPSKTVKNFLWAIIPICFVCKIMGQGKNLKMRFSSYLHIYG